MQKKRLWLLIFWVLCFFLKASILFALTPAEEKQLFQLLGEIKGELKQINKRIDDLNKRIDDTNNRITEVKEELNKRIDDTNKRIDKLIDIMIGITAVFGGLVVAMMGLVFWDRKTLIEKAVDKAVQQVERRSRLLLVLREFAKTDERSAEVMKSFGLL